MSEPTSKPALRAAMRSAIRELTEVEKNHFSQLAVKRCQEHPVWTAARSVLLFAPLPDEPDIWPLLAPGLQAGKTVALPRFDHSSGAYHACRISEPGVDLCHGKFGIREPGQHCPILHLKQLDLVLVPGLAFDLHGARLGRGKGFYDRLLASVRGTICGVAFDQQIVSRLPIDPHDIHVGCILTPTRWIDLQAARRS